MAPSLPLMMPIKLVYTCIASHTLFKPFFRVNTYIFVVVVFSFCGRLLLLIYILLFIISFYFYLMNPTIGRWFPINSGMLYTMKPMAIPL